MFVLLLYLNLKPIANLRPNVTLKAFLVTPAKAGGYQFLFIFFKKNPLHHIRIVLLSLIPSFGYLASRSMTDQADRFFDNL